MATVDQLKLQLAELEQLIAQLRAAEERASEIQVQIARQDPTQASAAALTYLRQNEGLPVLASTPLPGAQVATQPDVPLTSPTSVNPESDAAFGGRSRGIGGPAIGEIQAFRDQLLPSEEAIIAAQATQAEQNLFIAQQEGSALFPSEPEPVSSEPNVGASAAAQPPEFDEATAASTAEIIKTARTSSITAFAKSADWRLRLSLAPSANYLYVVAKPPDILYPLQKTNGVIFPYTPLVNVTYSANYESTDLTHTNYKHYNYKNSSVENISITADFTAQDTEEANYLLAVIHFFKSVTKMFYGKDANPIRGVPPPLCYLSGYGTFGFDNHPVAVTTFTYNLPNDVDFINAGPGLGGNSGLIENNTLSRTIARLQKVNLQPGGFGPPPKFTQNPGSEYNTRVPTKIQIILSCIPIVSRKAVSNYFSLAEYATGKLLRGSKNPVGGGYW